MATIPNPATFTVQEKLTAALMNSNVRDAVNFLIAPPLCVLTNTVLQAIANTTVTAITFDTEATDTDGMHSTVSNTSRVTAVTPGWYLCSGTVPWAGNATGIRAAVFQINGVGTSRIGHVSVQAGPAGANTSVSTSVPLFLNVGDYVELMGQQTSGGSLNTDASTNTGGVRLAALWVHT